MSDNTHASPSTPFSPWNRTFLFSAGWALVLLIASLVFNFYAGVYATESASNAVTDIVLSNIRVFDVDSLFVYGFLFLLLYIAFLCIQRPQRLPFTVKTIALFVLVRSVFISLTHIGPYPIPLDVDTNVLRGFFFGGDLFFSGHTGLPFLMALIFWGTRFLRYVFLAASITFGCVVLLGHLHYSIDVLAAFFITYTIYHIATRAFTTDYKIFSQQL